MILSDRPSPAEASDESANGYQASRRRETGYHPRIKSGDRLFRDHALEARFTAERVHNRARQEFAESARRGRTHIRARANRSADRVAANAHRLFRGGT